MWITNNDWDKIFKITDETTKRLSDLYNKSKLPIYPNFNDIWKSFELLSLKDTKAVVIGQDPYPNGIGIGYAFAFDIEKNFGKKPVSFKRIEKEWKSELSPDLKEWVELGILSINAAMTVKQNLPNSHSNIWKNWMINFVSKLSKEKKLMWVLLGRKAQYFENFIQQGDIIKAPHPATRYNNFVGSGALSKLRQYLYTNKKK